MSEFTYGPVEFFVVEFPGERPDPAVLRALAAQNEAGAVRALDIVIARHGSEGTPVIQELTETDAWAALGLDELDVQGLISSEDIAEALESAAPGMSVAVVALEHTWALRLSEQLAHANGRVVRSERITAADVNQLIAEALAAAPD